MQDARSANYCLYSSLLWSFVEQRRRRRRRQHKCARRSDQMRLIISLCSCGSGRLFCHVLACSTCCHACACACVPFLQLHFNQSFSDCSSWWFGAKINFCTKFHLFSGSFRSSSHFLVELIQFRIKYWRNRNTIQFTIERCMNGVFGSARNVAAWSVK